MNYNSWLHSFAKLFKQLIIVYMFFTLTLNALSLEEAVFQTLGTNPEIKEQAYNLKGVKQEKDMALSAYYPKIFVSAGIGTAKEEITPSFNEQNGERALRTDNSINLSLNIFNGFNTYYDLKSQKHRTNAAKSFLNEYKASISMQIVESFINMMKLRSILQIGKSNVLWHKEINKQLQELSDAGMGKVSDLRFASVRMTLAEVNAVVFENNFIQAKVTFEVLLGKAVDVDKLEEPTFEYILPESLEDAADMALNYNPSIQVGKHNIKSAYSNYKRSQSTYYPTLDIEMRESWLEETGPYEYSVYSSQAMVYLRYSLFNGFLDKATKEREFTTYLQNNQFIFFTQRDVTKKLGTAWIGVIKIEEQLKLLEKMRLFSKAALDDYYKEFGIGRRTLLDIINVKNDYDNARQSYEAAKYDLLLSKFRILDAMGGLVNYFLLKSQKMQFTLDDALIENKSVYEIIKQMNDKLKNNEAFISYGDGNITSFDEMMKEHDSNQEEIKELEALDDFNGSDVEN